MAIDVLKAAASKPPLQVCLVWDDYSPKCEGRIMMDALKLSSEHEPSFYLHPSMQQADRGSASRVLMRLGFQAMEGIPESPDCLVLQYASTEDAPDLPEELMGRDLVTRVLNPAPAAQTMELVDTSPDPRQGTVSLGDGTPTFRSRIPQGVSSLMALPAWAWL